MQEPPRFNLNALMQKNIKAGDRKSFLHRVIYIASHVPDAATAVHDAKSFIILIESNIKLINEDFGDDPITGFGLFYTGYFINILEGPEDLIVKHLATLLESFDKDITQTPQVTRMKVLLTVNHINKRFYTSWNGRQAVPPVLLDKIEPTLSPEVNSRHIQICITKLYKISEYLGKKPQNLITAVMDNLSDLCRQFLPEVNLLDFLLSSPGLMDVRKYVKVSKLIPDFQLYHETIWPLPSDFVPTHILSDDTVKKLMSVETSKETETEQGKEKETEAEAEDGEGEGETEQGKEEGEKAEAEEKKPEEETG